MTTSKIPLASGSNYVLVVTLQTLAHGTSPQDPIQPPDGNDPEDPSGEDLQNVGFRKPATKKTRKKVTKKKKKATKKVIKKKKAVKTAKSKKKRAR